MLRLHKSFYLVRIANFLPNKSIAIQLFKPEEEWVGREVHGKRKERVYSGLLRGILPRGVCSAYYFPRSYLGLAVCCFICITERLHGGIATAGGGGAKATLVLLGQLKVASGS